MVRKLLEQEDNGEKLTCLGTSFQTSKRSVPPVLEGQKEHYYGHPLPLYEKSIARQLS
jgi:hypothetical protein